MLKVKSKNNFSPIVEASLTVNEVCPMTIRQLDPVEICCAAMSSSPLAAELPGAEVGNSSESSVSCSEKDMMAARALLPSLRKACALITLDEHDLGMGRVYRMTRFFFPDPQIMLHVGRGKDGGESGLPLDLFRCCSQQTRSG